MANVKETTIEFNAVATLMLINSDDALKSMYVQEFGTDINMAISLAKINGLKPVADKFLNEIFETIITVRKEYVEKYQEVVKKFEKENKLPRRYGKKEIMEDVKKQGGEMNEIQRMLLKSNDLKNLYARLNRMGISAQHGNSELADNKCREIIGAIDVLLTRLENI